jgi:hypothetical protein
MSSIKEFISYCSNCGKNTTFIENRLNHLLHAILSIFLLGTWLIVWLCLIIFKDKKTQCKTCGAPPLKDHKHKLGNIAEKTNSLAKNMFIVAILGAGLVIFLELTGIGQNCEIKYLCRP